MCGIVGIKSNGSLDEVEKMLSCLDYRGPDEKAVTKAGAWSLGHARLSVLDLPKGSQPMCDKASGAHIVHNGEIYNFKELQKELGGKFKTQCDTEVLLRLHASDMEPEEWLPKLDGMYAFAIVDDDGLLLARDPLGIKPLYLGLKGDTVVFGSEIKSVMRKADRIMEFPPGHVYTSKKGGRCFREIKEEYFETVDADEIAQELLARLTDAIHARLLADVPVGVFLSGGLDSSIIAAIANQFKPGLKTFAVGMEGSPDLEAARQVAKHIGTEHYQRIFTLDEALKVLPKVIYHLESFDAGLVRSAIPNYFLAELAAEHVKVALSGEGADELFAGYSYLTRYHGSALMNELKEITQALHFTNLQRCDRMSMAHGLEVRVPFVGDLRFVEYAMAIPVQYKLEPRRNIEKWILRRAVEGLLPDDIVHRKKLKFAQGVGIGSKLEEWAAEHVTDTQFERLCEKYKGFDIRDKEELVYFLIFRDKFPPQQVAPLIGRSRSV